MTYKEKYLKYKQKYLELKSAIANNQTGGHDEDDEINSIDELQQKLDELELEGGGNKKYEVPKKIKKPRYYSEFQSDYENEKVEFDDIDDDISEFKKFLELDLDEDMSEIDNLFKKKK